MLHNRAMRNFLSKLQKKQGKEYKLNYVECIWYWTLLVWETEKSEIIISRDNQKIADYLEQFDELDHYDKAKPLPPGAGGIQAHQTIHKFTAGCTRGPQKQTVLKKAGITKEKQRNVKIINLDK